MIDQECDVLVVGGGIAGMSLACELAGDLRVTLLEMERSLAFHSTGRSAAAFLETYGSGPIRALTTASRTFFTDPPSGLFDQPLVSPRPLVYIAGPGEAADIRRLYDQVRSAVPQVELLATDDIVRLNPLVRPDYAELGLFEPGALDVDVHALHSGFVRGFRRRDGRIVQAAPVVEAYFEGTTWCVSDGTGTRYRAATVVNAAGAWCDEVASLFGARSAGLRALRRTVFAVSGPPDVPIADLPTVFDLTHPFYVKPESGQLLCSPADESPQPAGDVRPDELEIARALDALHTATSVEARHVRTSWAGLRTSAPDDTPVVGFDPDVPGLFWFAGQGGYGIQTCPALARVGAALVRGKAIPRDLRDRGITESELHPDRLRRPTCR